MWYIENRKGKPETHGLPSGNYNNCFIQPFTIGSSGRLFLSPEDLFTQTHKSDNEYHELNQISVCNIHWHRPPFFRPEGQPLRNMEGRPPFMCSGFPCPHITTDGFVDVDEEDIIFD